MGNHSLSTELARPFVVTVGEGAAMQQFAVRDPASAFRALVQLLAEAPQDVCGAWGVSPEWPEPISLVVRYRPGIVGETQRVAHVVPTRPGEWHGDTITAWCETPLEIPNLEFLSPEQGMPCVECIRRAAAPMGRE